ncbi:MAG: glycoside hydrolase family 88 protein [Planctomycetes bacterium]|nr:glycoside hydrolase family 88 protein [Planctomycetota bacterium]MBU4399125.1 glycoside hydrolase family 88 protein [Planctomycetota bacterium]
MQINHSLRPADLSPKLSRLWDLSGAKILEIEKNIDPAAGAPVYTVQGKYTARGWTEWTQGFQFGSALLQFDATEEAAFLEIGRRNTVERMAPHVSHVGVHDHGFNNISTYGNLRRLMNEGRIAENAWERRFYELALKLSGAIQARRWTETADGGYIYSFNGPHSLFVDTIRSLRVLALSHRLGHVLREENDREIPLLDRLKSHALSTAKWSIFYGKGRDIYDVRGRVAHEIIFNVNDGGYRCPNSQQGYSPFSTWTRGLAWAMCGMAEQLEFLESIGYDETTPRLLEAARATCDFYIEQATADDGIPYWDTGAPNLDKLGDWRSRPADPLNPHEPVDSSAAAIAAQGLLRLGRHAKDDRYWQAGLTVLDALFDEPYLSAEANHQGLILHSVYHRPNGWDHVPEKCGVPCGESSMWGDYHAREVALYVQRIIEDKPYLTFWGEPT